MKEKELMMLLQDIAEEDANLLLIKNFYVKKRKNNLHTIKEITKYGLGNHLFELLKYEENKSISSQVGNVDECIKIVENNKMWDMMDYGLCFTENIKYYWIVFGPYGPVGEHAFEGARVPDEFTQFIIND